MVFSSLVFLFLFLPVTLILYYLAPRAWRNAVLLAVSLLFYAWGETQYIAVMLVSIAGNYLFGLAVDGERCSPHRKKFFIASVIFNLGMLVAFKYTGFLAQNVAGIFGMHLKPPAIRLPLGISFFTFHSMSYVADVYKRNVRVQKSLRDLALYICLFPQLVAGPIIRYNSICDQLYVRDVSLTKFGEGMRRFLLGLFKKTLIANELGLLADMTFGTAAGELTTATAWMGIAAYTLQIYFDFSGYSDMAIGLGKMFGFDFPENFNYPYISRSVAEFWRRWHISLGSWFRDYLYIPLGGNRVSGWKVYRNLFVVWLLTGLWHGASWTFLLWGVYFGAMIALERLGLGKLLERAPRVVSHGYLIFCVMLGWVFFRADNFTLSVNYLRALTGQTAAALWDEQTLAALIDYGPTLLAGMLFAMPVYGFVAERLQVQHWKRPGRWMAYTLQTAVFAGLFLLCVMALMASTYNPFLYFRF